MKKKLSYLFIAAFFAGATLAQAQEKKATPPPSGAESREQFKNLTPEERAAKMKEWREKQDAGGPGGDERRRQQMQEGAKQLGLNPEELRNMNPEERRAKMSEALDKKLVELKKKQTDKTITPDETKLLERLENRKKQMEQYRNAPPRRDGAPGQDQGQKEGHKDGHPGKDGSHGKPGDKGPEHKGPPKREKK